MKPDYKIRTKLFPEGYPKPGTRLAQVLECLEAEPATAGEIAEYLGDASKYKLAASLAFLLIGRGLVVRIGYGKYQLVDAELVSCIYGSYGNL